MGVRVGLVGGSDCQLVVGKEFLLAFERRWGSMKEHTCSLCTLYPLIQTMKVARKMWKVFDSLLLAIFIIAIPGLY